MFWGTYISYINDKIKPNEKFIAISQLSSHTDDGSIPGGTLIILQLSAAVLGVFLLGTTGT